MEKELKAIRAEKCFERFQQLNRDLGWLARFLKRYPAAHHISWVKDEIAKYYMNGDWDTVKKLTPGRGERKNDSALRKTFIDFLIFERVNELLLQGHNLTGKNGCLRQIEKSGIQVGNETLTLGFEQLKGRYYRFKKSEPARFIDNGKLIVGPAKVEVTVNGVTQKMIGFWTHTPD